MTDATAYCELKAHLALVELAVRALAEGACIHATAPMVQRDKHTICGWLNRAARQSRRGNSNSGSLILTLFLT